MITKTSWKRLREIVKNRDSEICQYCGEHAPDGQGGEADHILPLAQGGRDGIDNLVWACEECNQLKASKTLREWVVFISKEKPAEPLSPPRRELDWSAAGWTCDCGGYGYVEEMFVMSGHGHHKPNCPIITLQGGFDLGCGYLPKYSRIVNGKPLLYAGAIILGYGEERIPLVKEHLVAFEHLMAKRAMQLDPAPIVELPHVGLPMTVRQIGPGEVVEL